MLLMSSTLLLTSCLTKWFLLPAYVILLTADALFFSTPGLKSSSWGESWLPLEEYLALSPAFCYWGLLDWPRSESAANNCYVWTCTVYLIYGCFSFLNAWPESPYSLLHSFLWNVGLSSLFTGLEEWAVTLVIFHVHISFLPFCLFALLFLLLVNFLPLVLQ